MTGRQFFVLLGPDGAGKSSVLAEVARRRPSWRTLSTDKELTAEKYALITQLRRNVVEDVLPELGGAYSADFLASLMQTAVVHLRDRMTAQDPGTPLLMDSYYYKILAKCRLAGVRAGPLFSWWRSFPQPRGVLYLDVAPESAWRRSANGARLNPLEYFGKRPEWGGFESYQKQLRKLMLEEVRQLPVEMLDEQDSVAGTAQQVLEVLSR